MAVPSYPTLPYNMLSSIAIYVDGFECRLYVDIRVLTALHLISIQSAACYHISQHSYTCALAVHVMRVITPSSITRSLMVPCKLAIVMIIILCITIIINTIICCIIYYSLPPVYHFPIYPNLALPGHPLHCITLSFSLCVRSSFAHLNIMNTSDE